MLLLAIADLPSFGSSFHPYRDRAVPAAVAHATANVVAAVNFDQRGFDTLGEDTIFFGSVLGASALLRTSKRERTRRVSDAGYPLDAVRLVGYLWVPLTLVVGVDVVAHGALTPGGGFQGGVVLATGMHLLYVAGSYQALGRMRPLALFEYGDATGIIAFAGIGLAGLAVAGSFLDNLLPWGDFGQLLSTGTIPILNVAVGLEVGAGVMVLLAHFLEQAIEIEGGGAER
jgi:multicomponent Na+:H+ antiporter subunit B